jgi:hypothetical protein
VERLTESKTAQTAGILAVGSLAAAAWLALEAHGRGGLPGFQPLLFAALGPSLGFAVWWMGRPKDVVRGPAEHASDASTRAALEQAMSGVREEIARHLAASEAHVASQRAALDELVAAAPGQDAADDLWARAEALMIGRSPETPPPAVAAAGSETSIVEGLRDTIGSMEDLAGSIREAADGIDALSLIAEETSSAVHEMDAMFEQVKTNAADTLELTERVSAGAGRATRLLRAAEDELQRARSGGNQARAVVRVSGVASPRCRVPSSRSSRSPTARSSRRSTHRSSQPAPTTTGVISPRSPQGSRRSRSRPRTVSPSSPSASRRCRTRPGSGFRRSAGRRRRRPGERSRQG